MHHPQIQTTQCQVTRLHRQDNAAEEVTVTRSTARLAEASPPAIPLTMYTAGTARTGTSSTRSRYLPNVQRHVLMQNSWIKPAGRDSFRIRSGSDGLIAYVIAGLHTGRCTQ